MAETLISPGILATEKDQSFISQQPINFGAAIIGPTVKGPIELPTAIASWNDFLDTFGDTFLSASDTYAYFTSIAAYNYFNNGSPNTPPPLLVARVVSGSYTAATSSQILNNVSSTPGAFATASGDLSGIAGWIDTEFRFLDNSSNIYRFLPTASGNYQDDTDGKLYFFASGSTANDSTTNLAAKITSITSLGITSNASTTTISFTGSVSSSAYNGYEFEAGSASSFSTYATLGGGNNGIGSNTFVLETISKGAMMNSDGPQDSYGQLFSGSADNVRFDILNPNTASGTFTVRILRGDSTNSTVYDLETFNVSLDPKASNFITKVIGDYSYTYNPSTNQIEVDGYYPNNSKLVRVKQVNYLTPDYLDTTGLPKPQYTASIPVAATGAFSGASGNIKGGADFFNGITNLDTQGLVAANYDNMIDLLSNKDDYQFTSLYTPGLIYNFADHATRIETIISNTQGRGDSIYVTDLVEYGGQVGTVSGLATSLNSSYAATYWPWCQINKSGVGNVWVPASTMIAGVYAYNDSVSEPWFAPAGINRGGLGQVLRVEQKLPQASRDTLYQNKVNPIAFFPGTGVVVYGQKTLQTRPSALDRVNVRRLLITLKSYISQVANTLVFEQNTIATRNQFLSQVNPYLESVQQRQGLYAFKVVMDESNNTPDVIDRNQLVGAIYVQPTKTVEFIYLDFIITPTGATFPA